MFLIRLKLSSNQVTDDELTMVTMLPSDWQELVLKSKNIDASLVIVKKKFTEVNEDNNILQLFLFS